MKLILLLASIFAGTFSKQSTTSFYNLSFEDIDGQTVSMSQFTGKKILLVNIATNCSKANQLDSLQQLYTRYSDSLVVIGFPSSSFGHENRTDAQIKDFCQQQHGVSFLLAKKNPIAGLGIQSVYAWLTSMEENGVTGEAVKGDYQKYLIDPSGNLIGFFAPSLSPLTPELTNLLHN